MEKVQEVSAKAHLSRRPELNRFRQVTKWQHGLRDWRCPKREAKWAGKTQQNRLNFNLGQLGQVQPLPKNIFFVKLSSLISGIG